MKKKGGGDIIGVASALRRILIRQLLLRNDRNVIVIEKAGHLQVPELQFGRISRGGAVPAVLCIIESWQVRPVQDHRSAPTHLDAVRVSSQVLQPKAKGVVSASFGREVLRNESEAVD